ncbi:MAG: hypothetical protein PHH44_00550 [bacterium]|nr:hypothetical protein [bacterium]
MRTLFFSFLIFIMVLAVFGFQTGKLTGLTKDLINIRKEFNAALGNKDTDPTGPAVLDQEQLRALLDKQAAARQDQEKDLDPEVKQMLSAINKENIVVLNPIMNKIVDKNKPGPAATLNQLKDFDLSHYMAKGITNLGQLNRSAGKYFCLSAFIVFLLMLVTRFNSFSSIGYLFANTGFIVSRILIFVSAVTAIVVHFSLKFNILTNLGSIFIWGPLFLMTISALSLKIYDFNNPVWNRMFFSVLWPIASGVIMHFA